MPNYKDFPKSDLRRTLVVMFALERLNKIATLHHVAQDINCSRSEAQRAIEVVQEQLGVVIEKNGPAYTITSWGVINRDAALALIEVSPEGNKNT